MIFDRTQEDIENAVSIRARLQKGETLTEDDIQALERGTLTINTLNRIEEKQIELEEIFMSLGYWNLRGISDKSWDYEQFFVQADFDRILKNLEILRDAYFVYKSTPIVPNRNYRQFTTINAVEHILNDLEKMVDDMREHYRICGVDECGGD